MAKVRLGASYVRLWSAATVSNLGDGVTLAALPLLAASLTRSPTSIAAISLAGTLPWLLFALISGALADRLDRKRTMVLVDGFRMLVMAGLAILVLTEQDTLVLLALVAFALGSAETLFDNSARVAATERRRPRLARGRQRPALRGRGRHQPVRGPPLGALLFAAAAAAPFLLDVGSFGIAALVVLGLRGSFRPERPVAAGQARPSIRADIAEGLRWLRRHELLRTLALALGVINMLEAGVLAVLVLYSLEVLGLSQTGYGVLLTVGGVGGLAGSFLARSVSAKLGAGTFIIVATLGFGATMLVPGLWANPIAVGAVVRDLRCARRRLERRDGVTAPGHRPRRAARSRANGAYRLLGLGDDADRRAARRCARGGRSGSARPSIVGGVITLTVGVVMIPWVNNRKVAAARAAVATS